MWLRAKCLRCTVLEACGDIALKTLCTLRISFQLEPRSHCVKFELPRCVKSAGESFEKINFPWHAFPKLCCF